MDFMKIPYLNVPVTSDWQDTIKNIPDNSIDMVITDPPYGMNYQSNRRKTKHNKIKNDTSLEWVQEWCEELNRICKSEAHMYVFCSWHKVEVFKKHLRNVKNILIWEKNNIGMGDLAGDYAPKYEMCIFCSNGEKKLNGKRDPNILKSPRIKTDYHPTEKPLNLIKYLITKSSNKKDIVLDTFAGSFTTALAAKELERNYICFEIDPKYTKIGKQRLYAVNKTLF